VLSQFTRVTDRQTDSRTDRILIAIPRLRYGKNNQYTAAEENINVIQRYTAHLCGFLKFNLCSEIGPAFSVDPNRRQDAMRQACRLQGQRAVQKGWWLACSATVRASCDLQYSTLQQYQYRRHKTTTRTHGALLQ